MEQNILRDWELNSVNSIIKLIQISFGLVAIDISTIKINKTNNGKNIQFKIISNDETLEVNSLIDKDSIVIKIDNSIDIYLIKVAEDVSLYLSTSLNKASVNNIIKKQYILTDEFQIDENINVTSEEISLKRIKKNTSN